MTTPQLDPPTILLPPGAPAGRLAPPAGPLADPATATDARRAGLDARLLAALRGAARALGFDAAELWLLDDASQRLSRRVAWQDDPQHHPSDGREVREVRPLARADADLIALAGRAVVAETSADCHDLGLHRPAGSAIGLPAASDLTIHGVLWLFGPEQRVEDATVELVEIVAARLAVEIERDDLLREAAPAADRFAEPDPTSLALELPSHALQHDALDAAGWIDTHAGVAVHDWAELADGRVLTLAGFVLDSPGVASESALIAAQTARVAARTLAPACDDAGQLLTRVNAALWQSTASGEGVAMAVSLVDPDGAATFATAGPAVTLEVRPSETLSHTGEDTPLGWDLDAVYEPTRLSLAQGERLVIAVGDPRITSPADERALADTFRAATGEARSTMTAAHGLKRLETAGTDALAAAASIRRR